MLGIRHDTDFVLKVLLKWEEVEMASGEWRLARQQCRYKLRAVVEVCAESCGSSEKGAAAFTSTC